MKKVTPLSVQDLIDTKGGPLFVINTSSRVLGGGGGDIFISLEIGKQYRTLRVPRTWIATEVTRSFPRAAILESASFLEAMNNGLITAISSEDAARIQNQPGWQEEVQRLAEFENSVREAGRAKGISKNVTVSGGRDGEEELDEDEDEKVNKKKGAAKVITLSGDEFSEEEATVSAAFQGWVLKLNAMKDEKAARNEIRLRGEIEEEEAIYMMENIRFDKIKASLARSLGV